MRISRINKSKTIKKSRKIKQYSRKMNGGANGEAEVKEYEERAQASRNATIVEKLQGIRQIASYMEKERQRKTSSLGSMIKKQFGLIESGMELNRQTQNYKKNYKTEYAGSSDKFATAKANLKIVLKDPKAVLPTLLHTQTPIFLNLPNKLAERETQNIVLKNKSWFRFEKKKSKPQEGAQKTSRH